MSMETKGNVPPCSTGTAACNPAVSEGPSVADSDPTQQFTNNNWPKFLVIKSKDNKSIVKHNIFVVSKALEGIAGTVKNVSIMKKSDMIVVEVSQKQQAINLLGTTMLHDIPVEVSAHRTLNSIKGVFTCEFLDDLTDKEILHHLNESGQNVKEVQRIKSKRDGKLTLTNTVIVTFNGDTRPDKLYVGLCRVSVRPYIPNPRQCYNCYKFRHTKNFCREKDEICGKCGQTGHGYDDCNGSPFCVNCKGDHPSSSRACPVWKQEKRIVELKVTENISFTEAVRKIENGNRTTGKSTLYSKVVSSATLNPKCTVMCQTDLTWPNFLTSPVLTSVCFNSNDKGCQSATENIMEFESSSSKRSRGQSSSSHEEEGLPDVKKPPKRITNPSSISVKEQAAPHPDVGGESTDGGETGGACRSRSPSIPRRGRTGRRGRPPDQSFSPASRCGGDLSSRTGTGRKPSPIKLPH